MSKKRIFKAGSLARAGEAGFLFLAAKTAASLLSPRSPGCGLVAIGEGIEKLASVAKTGLAKKVKQSPEPVEEVFEDVAPTAEEPVEEVFEDVFPAAEEPIAPEPVKEEMPVAAEEPAAPEFTANGDLGLIDANAQPERYAALLELEKRGEIELIRRYRRSYESRLIQSKDPMQDYYSGLKNALMRYKGVKSRISWANETFHQGRNHLAKIIVKTSCLYIYLSVDPETLKGTKYESAVDDVSDTKKFGEFPTVIKIKGERKYKYALELIDRICAEDLALPQNKKFVEVDYRRPSRTDEELVEEGLIKLLVAPAEKAEH